MLLVLDLREALLALQLEDALDEDSARVAVDIAVRAAGGEARALDLEFRLAQLHELGALLLLDAQLGGALTGGFHRLGSGNERAVERDGAARAPHGRVAYTALDEKQRAPATEIGRPLSRGVGTSFEQDCGSFHARGARKARTSRAKHGVELTWN